MADKLKRKYGYDTSFTTDELIGPLAKHLLASGTKAERRVRLGRIEEQHGKKFADRLREEMIRQHRARK